MLSYRKSQQVSLTEKLKKKNVIHAFGASGSGTTMARFCHSAFVRVATSSSPLTMWTATFATAHSCGLRPIATNYAKSGKRFATAHSRGLRRFPMFETIILPMSLPQRIRAGCDVRKRLHRVHGRSLPQRIRAGCDRLSSSTSMRVKNFATAHSTGLRQ